MYTITVPAEVENKYVRSITVLFLAPMSGEPPLQLIDYAYAASDNEYPTPMDGPVYTLLRKLARTGRPAEPGLYVCHSQLTGKPGSKRVNATLAKQTLRKVHAIGATAYFNENFGPKKDPEYLDIQIYADSHLGRALTALSDHWGITIPSVIEDALSVECTICAENFIPEGGKDPSGTDPYEQHTCPDCQSMGEDDDEDEDAEEDGDDEDEDSLKSFYKSLPCNTNKISVGEDDA